MTNRPRPVDHRGVPLGPWLHEDAADVQRARREAKAMQEVSARVTAAQRRAAQAVIESVQTGRRQYPSVEALAEAIATAVLVAEDDKDLRVVLTDESAGLGIAYGPFVSENSAIKALGSGALATRAGVKGRIFRLVPTPRQDSLTKIGAPQKRPTTRKRNTS